MKKIFLGTSGFSYKHWVSKFYPENLNQKEWLPYYSKHFQTVEINSTFYKFPFKNILKSWYNKTPKNFIFSLKANKLITHNKKLKNTKKLLNNFYNLAKTLKEKSGPILFQLPPSLKKDTKTLNNFLKNLSNKYTNVIEFRSKTWFCKEVYEILKQNNTTFCIINHPKLNYTKLTSKIAYIRWHGSKNLYTSNYTLKELKNWTKIIKNLKCKKLFGYFNNDYNAYAIKNCKQLIKLLKYNKS